MAGRNGSWPRYRSRRLDTVLNIVRLLAGPELDDAKVCETVEVEGIFLDDGFDLLTILAHSQDDPALSRYLSARDEEIAGSVVLLQETDVRSHVRVDLPEAGLVDELDDEHGRQPASKAPRRSSGRRHS